MQATRISIERCCPIALLIFEKSTPFSELTYLGGSALSARHFISSIQCSHLQHSGSSFNNSSRAVSTMFSMELTTDIILLPFLIRAAKTQKNCAHIKHVMIIIQYFDLFVNKNRCLLTVNMLFQEKTLLFSDKSDFFALISCNCSFFLI